LLHALASVARALQADICQLGNDQRKVNMLAREYCDLTKRKLKPIIVSHSMLPGLKEGQEKMSKSEPESAIFMEDSEAEVKTKIKKAFCPPDVVEGNPCIGYVRHIILPWAGAFRVSRPADNGGDKCAPTPRRAAVLRGPGITLRVAVCTAATFLALRKSAMHAPPACPGQVQLWLRHQVE
jgi:tRNA synthetases class I (W and Y)